MFNAEKHFLSKAPKHSSSKLEANGLRIWLGNTPYIKKSTKNTLKDPVFPHKVIPEETASDLHQLFLDFIQKAKKESTCGILPILLYKMELTGALVSPIHHRTEYDPEAALEKGVLVNETKNTLEIAFHGRVKMYPKAMHNFILYIEGMRYFIIGPALKLERRFSK